MTDRPCLERPIAADWLSLRRAPDGAAREAADGLLVSLAAAYDDPRRAAPTASGPVGPVAVVDVGAGTGANRAYLEPRLPFPTTWTLLDHDPGLLADGGNTGARAVVGGIEAIPTLLADLAPGPRLVTCSALLDLLTVAELDALLAAVLDAAVPALFALTVTGGVRLDPPDPADALLAEAFDAHQARAGRPGPQAAPYVARAARAAGAVIHEASTPWRVAADEPSARTFLRRYLTDRATAATEQLRQPSPGGADAQPDVERVAAWLARRLAGVDAADLRLVVAHLDLLLLPRPGG